MPSPKTPPQGTAATQAQKVRENRLRRMALRQGLVLEKSPRRDKLALDYARWRIGRKASRGIVWEKGPRSGHYTVTLEDVERRLTGAKIRPRA